MSHSTQIANFCDEYLEEERSRLYKIDSIEVLDYIRQSVEILMNMKGEEYDQYIKNREMHEKLSLKEEKKRLKKLIKGDGENKKSAGRNNQGPSRFILSSSMLTGSSMQMSVDNNSGMKRQQVPAEDEEGASPPRAYEK